MFKKMFLVLLLAALVRRSSGICWTFWDCSGAEETTTTTRATTTPTTPSLQPGQCRNCSQWSVCAQSAEDGVCDECACPKGLTGPCCDKLERNRCALETNLCPPFSSCEFDLVAGYKCVCHGAGVGPNCTEPNPCEKDPCMNGGVCSVDEKSKSFECECPVGITGEHCETTVLCVHTGCACRGNQCQNGATCYVDPLTSLIKYSCLCPKGYVGDHCEEELPCVNNNPCKYGGLCQVDPVDPMRFSCICPSIFRGKLCDKYDPCHTLASQCEHGICVPVSDYNAECSCIPGYNGTLCQHDIDDCAPNPCQYGGVCKDLVNNYTCTCPIGTSGRNCEINFDDCKTNIPGVTQCMQRDKDAICIDGLNAFTCNCSEEWTGENCTMRTIIWNVIKSFNNTDINLLDLLEDLVLKPSLITDIVPFFLALLPAEKQSDISWDQEDMFAWATFEGQELDLNKDIVKWNAATLGNCFTFNHDSQAEKMPLRYAGEQEGFRALMRVRQDEYLDWIDTASLLVFVHSSTESVFGESLRFQARPGGETSLMISQTSFERLGGKYGVCVTNKDEVESYYYEGEYTTDGCLRSCYQDAVFEACGCMDPRFPRKQGVNSCDMSKRTCVMRLTEERGDPSNWPECECPLPCSNGQFTIRWSQVESSSTIQDCSHHLANQALYTQCAQNKSDQVLISVHFPQMIQQTFKEEPKMDLNKFIANLGGLLGVLCGISILTFIEFGFLLFRLCLVATVGK